MNQHILNYIKYTLDDDDGVSNRAHDELIAIINEMDMDPSARDAADFIQKILNMSEAQDGRFYISEEDAATL